MWSYKANLKKYAMFYEQRKHKVAYSFQPKYRENRSISYCFSDKQLIYIYIFKSHFLISQTLAVMT